MLSATIEAGVFAPPVAGATPSSVREYVATLLHWAEVLSGGDAEVLTSRATSSVLVSSNSFPLRPWLRQMLNSTGVTEYDANTVARLAETLLVRAVHLEDVSKVDDVLFENLVATPDIFASHQNAKVRWEDQRSAVILAILGAHTKWRTTALFLIGRDKVNRVTLTCQIPLIEHQRTDFAQLPRPTDTFSGQTHLGRTLHDCLIAADEVKAWELSQSNDAIKNAIRLALYKHRFSTTGTANLQSLPTFRLHDHFFQSLVACGALTNGTLARTTIRSVIETVEHIKLSSTHELRVGRGANDEQVARGTDLAWRRDIDHEFHLHYWRCSGGVNELACIVHHEDFHICR